LQIQAPEGEFILYEIDECPKPTIFCSMMGSQISEKSRNVSASALVEVIGVEPTRTLIPVGLQVYEEVDLDEKDPEGYQVKIKSLRRQVAIMPEFFTVRARSFKPGARGGFTASSTYILPRQAETPYLEKLTNRQFVPGFCNGTWIVYQPNRREGLPAVSQPGSCWDLHRLAHDDDASVCNSATAVPCKTPRNSWMCTAGSHAKTIQTHGVYDGSTKHHSDPTTLTKDYVPGQTEITVESLSKIGFTNNGSLLTKRKIVVCDNGRADTYPPLTVIGVDQATNRLSVEAAYATTSCATGANVSLTDVCNVGNVTSTLTARVKTDSTDARIYYTLDGSEPSASSLSINSGGSVSFEPPKSLRAVAAGDGYINSFALDIEFRGACGACSKGEYNAAEKDSEFLRCLKCPSFRDSLWGSCGIEDCQCAAGYRNASSTCAACAPGQYKPAMGPFQCRACEQGKYAAGAASTNCTNCEAGKYKASAGVNTGCDACEAGKFAVSTASTGCTSCPAGKYSDVELVT
jgi:hypothetical protein